MGVKHEYECNDEQECICVCLCISMSKKMNQSIWVTEF